MLMPVSAHQVRSLHPYELRILLSLEHLMKRFEWVPLEIIGEVTGFSDGELDYRLGRLIASDLVRYQKVPYEGYALVFNGFDALALHTLTERNTVTALGSLIGVGKESVVYEALGLSPVILKFHRVGQRSFRAVRLNRGYLPDEGHIPRIFTSVHSADREYRALKLLHPAVKVPLPIDRNRHVVVMSPIQGPLLNRAVLPDPRASLDEILTHVRTSYHRGIIHGDLSEFNVMVEGGHCYLIDWPQWIETTHPNAEETLRRDVENILTFYRRKFRIDYPLHETIMGVTA